MHPLFDKDCELTAWIEPGRHIFDTTMNWVAFIHGGHVWSSETGNWLGPVSGMVCRDCAGRPLLWNPGQPVASSGRPAIPARAMRPMRPMIPMRPLRPARPARPGGPGGGWSQMTFLEWLEQAPFLSRPQPAQNLGGDAILADDIVPVPEATELAVDEKAPDGVGRDGD